MSMMLPPDMQALASGGGDPAAAAGGAGPMPPDIMALLGGGVPEGAPETEPPSVADGSPGGGEDALVQAIDLIQQAIDAEADQEDIQVMLQCQTKLQQILAKNQAEADAALGGKVSPKGIRKMTGGAGGAY